MDLTIRRKGKKESYFGCHEYRDVILGSLERFRDRVKQVCLYIEDINGHRGGVDKKCRCVLHLWRMTPVVIQDKDESMNALMHRIANRASYALSQKTDRKAKRVKQKRGERKQPLEQLNEDSSFDQNNESESVENNWKTSA